MRKWCVVVFGFFAAFVLESCTQPQRTDENGLTYIQIGDSITSGVKNSPGNTPGSFAVRAIATPIRYVQLGWPSEDSRQFNQCHREQLLDTLKTLRGQRIILGIAYGANDLPRLPASQVLASILRIARWAHYTARIDEVLIVPLLNRKDRWGYSRRIDGIAESHFNEERLWLNAQLHARARRLSGISVGREVDSPRMFAEAYPDDTLRCADKVHPTDLGAKELGQGTIARGIVGFGGITLK